MKHNIWVLGIAFLQTNCFLVCFVEIYASLRAIMISSTVETCDSIIICLIIFALGGFLISVCFKGFSSILSVVLYPFYIVHMCMNFITLFVMVSSCYA